MTGIFLDPSGKTKIGNMGTSGTQVAAQAFDGTTSQDFSNSAVSNGSTATINTSVPTGATSAFLGFDIGTALQIDHVDIWATNDHGHVFSSDPAVTLQLYGSNSSPANSTAGTLLGTASPTDANSLNTSITSTDQLNTYRYVWARVSVASSDFLYFAELKFYQTTIGTMVGSSSGSASVSGVGQSTASAAGSSAGSATASGVGRSTASAAGSSAGVATVAGVGTGVIGAAGSASGLATVSGNGTAVTPAAGSASGTATVLGVATVRPYTSSNALHKPVDYALAGEQINFKTGRAAGKALRHAFGE